MAPYNQNRDSEDCLSYINTLTLLKINYIMNKITYSTGNRSIRRSGNRFPKSLSQISSKIGISLLVLLSITINSLSSELSRGIGINGGSPLSGEGSPRVWNNRIGNLAANLNTASPTGSSAGTPAKTTELKITVEPRDNYAKADSGSNYVFSVSAAGAQNIRYQWQFNGIDLAGETKTSLVLSNPSPLQDGKYRVKISDGKNTIYSREARMGIVTPPDRLRQRFYQLKQRQLMKISSLFPIIGKHFIPKKIQSRISQIRIAIILNPIAPIKEQHTICVLLQT